MRRSWMGCGVVAVWLGSGCQSSEEGTWVHSMAYEGDVKLGGCVVADFDPVQDGEEIAVVAESGDVFLLAKGAGGWVRTTMAQLPGEMIQCAAGDLDPSRPGDELVTVGAALGGEDDGGPGAVWMISRGDDGWETTQLLEDDALVHGVAVADLDPSRDGDEVCVAGYSRSLTLLRPGASEGAVERLGVLRDRAKGVAAEPGVVWVAGAEGGLERWAHRSDGVWEGGVVHESDAPLARIAAREGLVLVSDNAGRLHHGTGDGLFAVLPVSTDRLRGAVLWSDDGRSVATAGYDGRIVLLEGVGGDEGPTITVVGRDRDRFHHLSSGMLPDVGRSLVGCGYAGNVIVAHPASR